MVECDILIIGSGPAGLSASSYASRSGYNTLVIDNMGPGGQLMFIDKIENYPGFEQISGYELAERFEKQSELFGAKIDYIEALSIEKKDRRFFVKTNSDEIVSKAVIIATGASHKHLGVDGEDEYSGKGVSYCATCDGPFFKNKDVVVVGGGDTALTDALYLSKLCSSVTIVHRRDKFRAERILQERVSKTTNIESMLSCTVTKINGDGNKVTSVSLSNGDFLKCDGVFIFVGTVPNSSLVDGICALKDGYIETNDRMETSLEGLFAAGDVRRTSFRQVVTAAGDGARAAHSADEYIQGL